MNYIQKILDDKYISVLYNHYEIFASDEKFRYQIGKFEKELTRYNGINKRRREPDYTNYIDMVYKKYLANNNEEVVSRYKGFLDKEYSRLPTGYYFILLFAKRFTDLLKLNEKHSEEEIKQNPILLYMLQEIGSEVKLLVSLMDTMENVVAAVINSIDNIEIEYLDDDLENLDSLGIKHRFLVAIQEREKNTAFKLIGKFREMDQGEDSYLEALAHFANQDYDNAIRYAVKVKPDDRDYGASVAMMLESYAMLGDSSSVVGILQYNKKMKYSKYHIIYLKQILIDSLDFSNIEILNTNLAELEEEFSDLETSIEKDHYFEELSNQYFAKMATEAISLIEGAINYMSINSDNKIDERTFNRLVQIRVILSLTEDDIYEISNLEYVLSQGIDKVKDRASTYFLTKLIDENENQAFSSLYEAFMTQYRLGHISEYCSNVNNNIESLSIYLKSGEERAGDLIELAYLESIISGDDYDELQCFVKELGIHSEELDCDIKEKQIEKFLSPKGRLAFTSAQWIYNKTLEEDYGWKDAGLLSLAYFRIIELELNEKIIIPMIEKAGYENLEKVYNETASEFRGKERDQYKRKWGTLIRAFKQTINPDGDINGIMLGHMEFLLKNIELSKEEDQLSQFLYKILGDIFNEKGLKALDSGELSKIIGSENRDKYRNPPAHTKFLNYEIACEAREFIIKELLNLSSYLAD